MGKTRQSANLVSDNNIFVNPSTDRVGIGSTIPGYKLDVAGNINLSGNLYQNGALFSSGVGIQSAGTVIGTGITTLNFIGLGNTFSVSGNRVDISISGSGSAGAGGTWGTYTAGIATNKSVGINTSTLDDSDLTGIGNSFKGLYVSNGMIVVDNVLSGDHYIGTNFNGLMVGPVTIEGTLTVDGNYVVV
jgi:hypothetical protein